MKIRIIVFPRIVTRADMLNCSRFFQLKYLRYFVHWEFKLGMLHKSRNSVSFFMKYTT